MRPRLLRRENARRSIDPRGLLQAHLGRGGAGKQPRRRASREAWYHGQPNQADLGRTGPVKSAADRLEGLISNLTVHLGNAGLRLRASLVPSKNAHPTARTPRLQPGETVPRPAGERVEI